MTYDIVLFTGLEISTLKPMGAFKCAHELRLAGFKTLVVSYLHWLSQEEIESILDLAVGDNTLFVGISNTFLFINSVNSNQDSNENDKIVLTNGIGGAKNPLRDFAKEKDHYFPNFVTPGFYNKNNKSLDEQKFASHVKKINSNCKIVVGGARTHAQMNNRTVDYAVIGYADILIVDLANHLRHGTPLNNTTKNIFGIHVINDGGLGANFDFANSSMVWTDDDIVIPTETLPLEISRGCIFRCKFCDYRLNGRKKFDYVKSFEKIRNELIYNYNKYGTTAYKLLDDTFNDTEEKLDIMLDIVKSLPFKPIFWAYIRLDLVSKHPGTIQKLVDIGVQSWFCGIETLNLKTGRIIGKGYDPVKLIETINFIKDTHGNKVYIYGSFIAGLPEETLESAQQSVDAINRGEIKLDSARWNPLIIMKKFQGRHQWDSPFGLDIEKYGYSDTGEPWQGNPNVVNWKNKNTNFAEVTAWCEQVESDFQLRKKRQTTGWESSYQSTQANLNNLHLGTIDTIINRYKQQLFAYLNQQHLLDTETNVQSKI